MVLYKGTDKFITFQRRNTNGEVITTAPQEIWFTVRQSFDSEDITLQKTLSGGGVINSSGGIWQIKIAKEDLTDIETGNYVYDIKVKDLVGNIYEVARPAKFVVKASVSTGGES